MPADIEQFFARQNVEIALLPEMNNRREFSSLQELQEFIARESRFWEQFTQGSISSEVRTQFQQIENQLRHPDSGGLDRAVKLAQSSNLVYSETATASFLARLNAIDYRTAEGAYDFLVHKSLSNASEYHHLNGILFAFHFAQGDTDMRLNAESEAVAQLRGVLQTAIERTRQLAAQADTRISEFQAKSSEVVSAQQNECSRSLSSQHEEFRKALESQQAAFDRSQQEQRRRIQELETTYREKLRLQGPADYWERLTSEYERKGRIWFVVASAFTLVLVIAIAAVMYEAPHWLIGQGVDTAVRIKAAVLLALAASMLVYLVRLCVKLSISAYHLSRDARERHQLTHVFLALIKDGAIDPKEREIVLQSIFSRADTGLLKGESTPAMPGGALSNLVDHK